MSWDNIDFDTLVTGCITTGYQENHNRVSMVEVLNYLIDALNEKIYATQYGQFPAFITEHFEQGSITFNDNFINDFNTLFLRYWQLWSAHDWYSEGVLSDPVNADDYLLTDNDLIAATSQDFFDLISSANSPTFQDKWSGLFFQNVKAYYAFMRYGKLEYKAPNSNNLNTRSGFITLGINDEVTNRSGAIREPSRLKNQAECTSMNDPALGFYSIDTIQSSAYNGLVADVFKSSQSFTIYNYVWRSGFSMSDFYNSRASNCSYKIYRDGTRVFIHMKKYSTDELLYDVPFSMGGYMERNETHKVKKTAQVDGGETTITYGVYDNSLPSNAFDEFDADRFNTATNNDATYGYGLSYFRDNGVYPFDQFLYDPPSQVCQNTSGQILGYGEVHFLEFRLNNYLFVDSNNIGLDYYIPPTP